MADNADISMDATLASPITPPLSHASPDGRAHSTPESHELPVTPAAVPEPEPADINVADEALAEPTRPVEDDKPKYPQPSGFYPSEHTVSHIPTYTRQSTISDQDLREQELEARQARIDAGEDVDDEDVEIRKLPWLTPEEDPLATRGIPIFHPTMEEFQDFEGYMNAIAPWGYRSGIVKIVPPAEWIGSLPAIPGQTLANLKIKSPIQQNMQGRSGMYRQNNIEKKRILSMKDWFEKCRSPGFRGPGPKDQSLHELREKGVNAAASTASSRRGRRGRRVDVGEGSSTPAVEETEPAEEKEVAEEKELLRDETIEADIAGQEAGEEGKGVGNEGVKQEGATEDSKPESPEQASQELEEAKPPEPAPLDPFYETFEPTRTWLPEETVKEDYNPEACKELERKFWRGLSLGEPSWYGADLKGSLFTNETKHWNVAHLPNLLNRLKLKRKLPGVNTPYLYFGMWAATFAWHVEDMDLFSINYIHFGAPKHWYAIPSGRAEHFERVMAGYFAQDAKSCNQFLRHKSFTVSPQRLAADSARPNVLVQHEGEFVITYPRGYHSGFNMGFNCAESINFALDSWVELGRRAQVCECEEDSVRIDVDAVLAESALAEAIEAEKAEREKAKAAARKRPRTGTDGPAAKRQRKPAFASTLKVHAIIPHAEPPKPAPVYPCVFCPNFSRVDIMPLHNPPDRVRVQAKAFGRPSAHLACARSIPELWTEDFAENGQSETRVLGYEMVSKDRWNLKCISCADPVKAKLGAKIQCTKGKCPRAFHVTCAMINPEVVFRELVVQEWVRQVSPIDGSMRYEEVHTLKAELLCSQHNPDVKEAKRIAALKAQRDELLALPPHSRILVRLASGQFEVTLLGVYPQDQLVTVMTDDRRQYSVKWSQIILKPKAAHIAPTSPTVNDFDRPHSSTSQHRADKYAIKNLLNPEPYAYQGPPRPPAVQAVHRPSYQSYPPVQAPPAPYTPPHLPHLHAYPQAPSQHPHVPQLETRHLIALHASPIPFTSTPFGTSVDFSKVVLTPQLQALLTSNPLLRAALDIIHRRQTTAI